MCLLNEKNIYWQKMCLLKGHNPLGINSDSYSFGNFFSTSSLSYFLEIQKNYGSSLKLLFVEPNHQMIFPNFLHPLIYLYNTHSVKGKIS